MRAKIASRAGGHVFEERFLKLDGLQLAIAYRQALKEEKEEGEGKRETILAIHKNWVERVDNLFKALYMFTNPQLYKNYEDLKNLDALREEIKPEEFPDMWEEILNIIPNEVVVEDPEVDTSKTLPMIDPELEEILTGFVPYKSRK
jgi:hypothetical protein